MIGLNLKVTEKEGSASLVAMITHTKANVQQKKENAMFVKRKDTSQYQSSARKVSMH
jgi:hypothetical protein